MKRMMLLIPAIVAAVIGLSACGGQKVSNTIDVNMVEFTFSPSEFTVPAGQEITFTAHNNGAVEHQFNIFKLGTDAGDSFDEGDRPNIYWEATVAPGDSITTTFRAPGEPGQYYVTCGTAGHMQAGMSGKLIVVPGG